MTGFACTDYPELLSDDCNDSLTMALVMSGATLTIPEGPHAAEWAEAYPECRLGWDDHDGIGGDD